MVYLGNEQRSFCHFWDCTKYCISDSFVDYGGYSTSSKGFLPMVVNVMVIWVKFFHSSSSILVHWFLKCHCSLLPSPIWLLPIYPDLWTYIPGSYAILFFTASDFTSITSHIHNWVLFLLWLPLFTLSGVISPPFPLAYWTPTNLGSSSFSVLLFCLSYWSWGFQGKTTEVVCHSLLQWTTICQTSPL